MYRIGEANGSASNDQLGDIRNLQEHLPQGIEQVEPVAAQASSSVFTMTYSKKASTGACSSARQLNASA